jgi:hypothetical protein
MYSAQRTRFQAHSTRIEGGSRRSIVCFRSLYPFGFFGIKPERNPLVLSRFASGDASALVAAVAECVSRGSSDVLGQPFFECESFVLKRTSMLRTVLRNRAVAPEFVGKAVRAFEMDVVRFSRI